METYEDRLAWRMGQLELSNAELARRVQVTAGNVSHWRRGQRPDGGNLIKLCRALRTNPQWLLDGVGDPDFHDEAAVPVTRVPLISWVQAGEAAEVFDPYSKGAAESWIESAANVSERSFALRVRGDSMEPVIPDGAIVIVDPTIEPTNGAIVVVRFEDGDEATIKKLVHDGNAKWLKPINPAYQARLIDGECHFVGVAKKVEIDL